MSYSSDWNEVEYTYHQWAEFDPKKSCKSCSLNDSLITVNRGYLQFLSASQGGPLDAESLVAFQLLPSSFRFTLDIIRGYMDSIFGVAQSEEVNTLAQWARCETLEVRFHGHAHCPQTHYESNKFQITTFDTFYLYAVTSKHVQFQFSFYQRFYNSRRLPTTIIPPRVLPFCGGNHSNHA